MSVFLLTFAKLRNSASFYQLVLRRTLETSQLFINNFDTNMQQKHASNLLVIDGLQKPSLLKVFKQQFSCQTQAYFNTTAL